MSYSELKAKLNDYYMNTAPLNAQKLKDKCFFELNAFDNKNPGLDNFSLKTAQYECIADNINPVIFDGIPFYFETGALHPFSDGEYGRGMIHANAWLILKNNNVFKKENPELWELFWNNQREHTNLCCGTYLDSEHYKIPLKKIFENGLGGVYNEAEKSLENSTLSEKAFLTCAMRGLLALKKISDKFAEKANGLLKSENNPEQRRILELIAKTAVRVPWEKPQTVYEGLATMAFMRKALGSIEGVGFNSMGRLDVLLYPLYLSDKERGVSDSEIYDLICKFLLIWDAHVDKSKKMQGYSDYEYENAITVGGCDENGDEVFNRITEFVLKGHYELDNMYPKIKCRFSSKSNKAYLNLINNPILHQKSILLYCNDDTIIPALLKHGYPKDIAYDYTVTGCWGVSLDNYCKFQEGSYVNTLRAIEWSINMPEEKLKKCGLSFRSLDKCNSFDEVYSVTLSNILEIIKIKAKCESEGAKNWSRCSPFCIFSSLLYGPIEKKRDYTDGGSFYNWETFYLAALPDTVDSLLAIKSLCYDKKVCTLPELLSECRNNWENTVLRGWAMRAPKYGDTTEESSKMLGKLVNDIYNSTRDLPTSYGGEWSMGSYMYTEVIWWGKEILATPNGRKDGDLISQGLTPSRLEHIQSVTDVFSSLRYCDPSKFSSGTVINIILPAADMTEEKAEAFLRSCAESNAHILQINCLNKKDLIAAQTDPEKYADIIVRVTGFSAQFIMLSREYQNEFLSRNFYK